MAGTLYAAPNNFRTFEVLISSQYSKSNISVQYADKPADSCKFPFGKLPCFETKDGKTLVGSHAIAKYVAQNALQGTGPSAGAEILQWLQLVDNELVPNILAWLLPSVSAMPHDKQHVDEARGATLHLMKILNDYLRSRTFLVGERLSLADVAVCCALLPAFQYLLDTDQRHHNINLTRWFETCIHQPQFESVLGKVTFCTKPGQFDAHKFKLFQQETACCKESTSKPAGKKDEKAPKKETAKKDVKSAPKDEKPKAAANNVAEELDETELALAQEPKQNDPFAAFPKGNFNMDEFKRIYSNEDTESKALPYFWEHFDKENYSIWYAEYKYADELTLPFMSCNLISGMFQRLDKLRKNAFASVCLFCDGGKSSISGIWVWRSHELAFTLSEDWKVDYESYDWKKLDAGAPETKTLVKEYFLWQGNFGGKKFDQGKIFK